jgi:uncharacterized protein (TIGR02001 family)
MNKFKKLSLIISLTLTVFTSSVLADDLKFNLNAAVTSNYIWRGMTQTQDTSALQGGFETSYAGLHAKVWSSSVIWKEDNKSETAEVDYTAGYTFKFARMELDLSYCAFTYPEAKQLNFSESKITLSSTIDSFTIGYSYSAAVDQNDTWNSDAGNTEVLISIGKPDSIGELDIVYGDYKEVGTYYTISYSKSYSKLKGTISYSSGLQLPDEESDTTPVTTPDTTTTKIDTSKDPKVFVTLGVSF